MASRKAAMATLESSTATGIEAVWRRMISSSRSVVNARASTSARSSPRATLVTLVPVATPSTARSTTVTE